jgi:hypothetical protein
MMLVTQFVHLNILPGKLGAHNWLTKFSMGALNRLHHMDLLREDVCTHNTCRESYGCIILPFEMSGKLYMCVACNNIYSSQQT